MKSFRIRSCVALEAEKAREKEGKRAAREGRVGDWTARQCAAAEEAGIARCGETVERKAFSEELLKKRVGERCCDARARGRMKTLQMAGTRPT